MPLIHPLQVAMDDAVRMNSPVGATFICVLPDERAFAFAERVAMNPNHREREERLDKMTTVGQSVPPQEDLHALNVELIAANRRLQEKLERLEAAGRDKQAEEELRERDERIQQALLVSRSFAFEWDPATDRVTRSKDCGPILRLEGEEIESDTGANYFRRVHAEDRDRFVALLQALTPAAPAYQTQYRIVCPDGGIVVLDEAGRAYFDAAGRLGRLVGITTDVTAREQAEAELREGRNQLSRAQEIAHLGSWELDLARGKLSWSDETYRIFGLEPQEFAPTYEAFIAHVHPEDRAAVDAAYTGSIRDGKDSYGIEHRIVRKGSGEIRWVQEKCTHMRDAQGKVIRSAGMVLDITERHQSEEALREANADLARFNRAMVDRELRMIELKAQINDLCRRAGQPAPYASEFSGESPA